MKNKRNLEQYLEKKFQKDEITTENISNIFKEMVLREEAIKDNKEEEEEIISNDYKTNPSSKLQSLAKDIMTNLWDAGLSYSDINQIIRIMDNLLEDVERENF